MGLMKQKPVFVVCLVIAVIAAAIGFYRYANDQKYPTTTATVTGCRADTFTVGDTGHCVKDIQTMANYMETAGLTECPFTGGKVLPVTGTYSSLTATQVKVVQNWANCYYKQEGMNMTVTASGNVDNNTWTELCDYAYDSPKQSNTTLSPYTQASIAAGQHASC